jgi:putative spermidine/putrescine transport system substrate-binding protein
MTSKLRVLSWAGGWGRALEAAVSGPFTGSTGIEVEAVSHVGLRLPSALIAALDQCSPPPVDVVWCNTTVAMRAAAAGYADPLGDLPVLGELRDRAQSEPEWAFGRAYFARAYVVHYVLVYRRALFPSAPPRSWEVMTHPCHAGRVVLYPQGKGFLPVAQLLGGGRVEDIPRAMDPCWRTVASIRKQLAPPDYSIGLGRPFCEGTIDLAYRALTNALAFQEDGVPVAWCVPDEGAADTTDAFWVPRGLPEASRSNALRYIAFALSRQVQERWCAMLGTLPMNAGAASRAFHPALPAHSGDRTNVLHIPEDVEAARELEWGATFDRLCQDDGAH